MDTVKLALAISEMQARLRKCQNYATLINDC